MTARLLYLQYKNTLGSNLPAHAHAFHEIVYILDGQATITLAGARRRFTANTILFYPPGAVHAEEHHDASRFSHIVIGLSGCVNFPSAIHTTADFDDQRVRHVLTWLLESYERGAASTVQHALLVLLLDFLTRLSGSASTDAAPPASVASVLDYMRDNLAKPLRLSHLADVIHVSEPYLEYLFKEQLAQSPIQTLLRERYQLACALLTQSELSVKAIALQCGFRDQRYFARIFKRYGGCTPTAYRQQAAGNAGEVRLSAPSQ
ncbi:MAG TPA: AraC family transcriptional regulator [Armatimonadota bacterium]